MEYWIRVLTVWAFIGTISAVLFAVTFLPVYVLVDAKIDAYQQSAEIASEKIASFESVSRELAKATQQAQLLITSTKEISLSDIITLLDEMENDGINLNQVYVARATAGLEPISLNGRARDRQSLASFRDSLLAHPSIQSVDFPISNLAKDRDIDFTITIIMANEITL